MKTRIFTFSGKIASCDVAVNLSANYYDCFSKLNGYLQNIPRPAFRLGGMIKLRDLHRFYACGPN
jgi:hypothetical protein